MARYRGTVTSDRPPEETFDYLAEFSNAAEWDPGVAAARRLDDGPVGLASAFLLDVRVGSLVVPLEYRVVAYQRPERVVLLGENATIRSEDTVTVVSVPGGGSALTYDADLQLKGPLSLFNPLLRIPFGKIGDRGLSGLRRVLAADPSEYPGAPSRERDPGPNDGTAARVVDGVLEATVVGSFSSIGPRVRSRMSGWPAPPSMVGRVVLVTGATSGLGLASAIDLARGGATVLGTARSRSRADEATETIRLAVPTAEVDFLIADLSGLDQVRDLAEQFSAGHDRLDVLIHNAGALSRSYTSTDDGGEITVVTQLVAPFLLTGLLFERLEAATPSRVIQVSSGGMYTQRFDLGELEMSPADYDGAKAYARVKRAQLVLMHEWVRRTGGSGVDFASMHPGWVDTPGIRSGLPVFSKVMRPLLRTPEEGADTVVWLASSPEALSPNGGFWLDRRTRSEHKVPWTRLHGAAADQAGPALWAWCSERSGWSGPTETDLDRLVSRAPSR